MHAPPSVSYPVGRSAFAGWVAAALSLAALVVALSWSLQSAWGWRQLTAFAAAFACAALAVHGWLRSPSGALHWDGAAWSWEEAGGASTGHPEIALDLQSRLLLRWHADGGGARWLWAEQASAPSHWDALRRAVYSRATAAAQ